MGQLLHRWPQDAFWQFLRRQPGSWYLNVQVQIAESVGPVQQCVTSAVGIDLDLKTCATVSTGQKVEGRFYRELEAKLAIAQRAGKKHRTSAIHEKIGYQSKDALHKFSTQLVTNNAAIVVGDSRDRMDVNHR